MRYIAGVDEVGRGPLVGDVVAAAVILKKNHNIVGLADSKKLTEKKRNSLYPQIIENSVAFAVGRASPQEIDSINILQASLLAMKRAILGLEVKPDKILVDGIHLPKLDFIMEAIPKGDSLFECISAASIIAKVTRDNEMIDLDRQYPEYEFKSHKGYPTKRHLELIVKHGVFSDYRMTFAPVAKVVQSASS
ncbi:MAG: ribonuclease HII [Francisellaceae bacterium]|jgi:ribonuclease HII|nr:ribonuclease HII [Francisellaceae bacterium]MBT6539542.1 ribonuclease HII [Francisellaceae bacterium]